MNGEQYRYRCPGNGDTDVVQRYNGTIGGVNPQARYYCRTCNKYGRDPHYDYVVDARTGKRVRP